MNSNPQFDLIAKALPFFETLSPTDQDTVLKTAKNVSYAKNTVIHKGLSECNGVVIVQSGILRAYLLSEQGKEVTLFQVMPGESCVLTAGCIIKNISFEIIISCETDCDLLVLNKKVFDDLKNNYPAVERFVSDMVNQRFSDTMWAVEKMMFLSFDKRLAMFLLEQSEQSGSHILSLTHSEIANHLGTAREVVTRMLNNFAKDSLVSLSKGKIELLDIKKLRAMI